MTPPTSTPAPWPVMMLAILLLIGCQEEKNDAFHPPPKQGEIDRVRWGVLPFTWEAGVSNPTPSLAVEPGGKWSLDFDAVVNLAAYQPRYGHFTELIVALAADPQFAADGQYSNGASSGAVSSNFSTGGIPVEYFDGWPRLSKLHGSHGSPFEGVKVFKLTPGEPINKVHRLTGKLTVELPLDTPTGHYRPRLFILARVKGVKDPVHLAAFADNWNEGEYDTLPLVSVGSPAEPHLPWTILAQVAYRGQVGVLPDELRGKVALVPRSGFFNAFIIPPGKYELEPTFPSVFPRPAVPVVSGGDVVIPLRVDNDLDFSSGQVRASWQGPGGSGDLGTRQFAGLKELDLQLAGGPFSIDMTRTGTYTIKLKGHVMDRFKRRMGGGGTYTVHAARPLSFSTSCKPGASFLVGDKYPPKVLVHPAFPAQVTVEVDYYPNSDPARKQTWTAQGKANRFGHFSAQGQPRLTFSEPGEYVSRVLTRFKDAQGVLWMGQQTSTGVIAPVSPQVSIHGTRSFPYGLKTKRPHNGGVKRFSNRPDMTTSFMPISITVLPDPYVPYDARDTLFVPTGGYNESLIEPHFSLAANDRELSRRLQDAHRVSSFLVPPMYQPAKGDWLYLKDVVQLSTDSGGWFPADEANADELPILPVSSRGWHPFAYPRFNEVEAYTIMGIIRPGFPVMTSVHQRDAIGLYWLASPNPFGNHFHNGPNGDLPGDLYRVMAGLVLKDRSTGRNHYDAYSAGIAVTAPGRGATAIRQPGERPLVSRGGIDYQLFIGIDTHTALEVGESLAIGGMVFPSVQADVVWTVTRPDGAVEIVKAKADRLGIARGKPAIAVTEPGLYRVKTDVRYGKLRGGVVFTADGSYWVCALPKDNPSLLSSPMAPVSKLDPFKGIRLPITWPKRLKDVKLHWGIVSPGQVIDQGVYTGGGGRYEYPLSPPQLAVQFPNLDVRNLGTGEWELADTLVFQFFLEATDGDKKVYDALRLLLRGDKLYNFPAMASAKGLGRGHPGVIPRGGD